MHNAPYALASMGPHMCGMGVCARRGGAAHPASPNATASCAPWRGPCRVRTIGMGGVETSVEQAPGGLGGGGVAAVPPPAAASGRPVAASGHAAAPRRAARRDRRQRALLSRRSPTPNRSAASTSCAAPRGGRSEAPGGRLPCRILPALGAEAGRGDPPHSRFKTGWARFRAGGQG